MKIMRIVPLDGIWTAILDNNTAVTVDKIKGSPRQGAMINEDFEIIGNNVDVDCPGGVCPIK